MTRDDFADLVASLDCGEHRLPCPNCGKGKRDDALSVTVDHDHAVWHCFRCGESGAKYRDGIATRTVHAPPRSTRPAPDRTDAYERARGIWIASVPLDGTLGADYLTLRGCILPPPDGDLRFHPALYCVDVGTELPALVARVSTVATNRGVGVHRIWIRPGSPKAVAKKRLGGADEPVCVRLWPDVTMGLAIAEGIETALGAARDFRPIWSTIDAGGMARFPILGGIESLTVFADFDPTGLDAATKVQARYLVNGVSAVTIPPPCYGEDWLDYTNRIKAGT